MSNKNVNEHRMREKPMAIRFGLKKIIIYFSLMLKARDNYELIVLSLQISYDLPSNLFRIFFSF